MTLKTFEQKKHTFLVMRYATVGFLVNQDQFTSSNYCEPVARIKSPSAYLSSLMKYNNMNVLVFDLDALLKDNFHCNDTNILNMALITDAKKLSPMTQRLFAKIKCKGKHTVSMDYIAFKIAVQAEMSEINISEIKIIPSLLKEKQQAEGVLGCRFNGKNEIQYLIDIDRLFYNSIKRKK